MSFCAILQCNMKHTAPFCVYCEKMKQWRRRQISNTGPVIQALWCLLLAACQLASPTIVAVPRETIIVEPFCNIRNVPMGRAPELWTFN